MKYSIIFPILILVSLSFSIAKGQEVNYEPPAHQQVETEREIGKALVLTLDTLSMAPGFNPRDFENMACILIDDLISENYLLSAGVGIHKAYNVLLTQGSDNNSLSNIVGLTASTAEMYLRAGAFDMASRYLDNADRLCKLYREEGKKHYLRNAFNIASLLCKGGKYEAAERIYNESLKMLEGEFADQQTPATINAMLYCAFLLTDYSEGDFFTDTISFIKGLKERSEVNTLMYNLLIGRMLSKYFHNYEKASKIYDDLQNTDPHLCHTLALPEIIENEWKLDPEKYRNSLPYYRFAMEDLIISNLNSFTTNQTEAYWDEMAKKMQHAFGLGLNNLSDDNFYLTGVFLTSAISKNLSAFTQKDLYDKIKTYGTPEIKSQFKQVIELRKRIGNTTDSLSRKEMQSRLEDLEWPLRIGFDIAAGFVQNNNEAVFSYNQLEPDECVVEILEYPFFEEDGTETPHYGAIILSKRMHHFRSLDIDSYIDNHEFIDLGPTIAWEMVYDGLGGRKEDRIRARQYDPEEMISVALLVKPLANKIERYRRAYVSSTGVINTINLGAVPYGEVGNPLNETVEIVKTNAVYDLGRIKKTQPTLPSAAIFANINYNQADAGKSDSGNDSETKGYRVKVEKGGNMKKFYSLPIDEKSLTDAIKKNSKKVRNYSGAQATEEAFKGYDGKAPSLIHIDSHGFYIPEESNAFLGKHTVDGTREKALLTCGLPLAGANIAWSGTEVGPDKEDGILTAWEVACMDLSDCKLAVLSACETAQGDVDPINGVLGLQRALRIAGVQSMLLTLWPVDNELTQEFINSFYSALPGAKDFNEAFVKTQKDFRMRHPDPYIWAPFILIN